MLDPITIAIACFVFNKPAPTKLTVITIVPVLDWINIVTIIPASNAIKGLEVYLSKT